MSVHKYFDSFVYISCEYSLLLICAIVLYLLLHIPGNNCLSGNGSPGVCGRTAPTANTVVTVLAV